jgi:hypothetical protein
MDYEKIYDSLMTKVRTENRVKGNGLYYERHHILPKCVGGEGHLASKKEHPNLILLTAREHYLAHKLLYYIFPNNIKIARAFWAMLSNKSKGREYRTSSKEYAELQEMASKSISGKNNPIHKMEKNPFSDPEFIKRNSEKNKGRVRTPEERQKIPHIQFLILIHS